MKRWALIRRRMVAKTSSIERECEVRERDVAVDGVRFFYCGGRTSAVLVYLGFHCLCVKGVCGVFGMTASFLRATNKAAFIFSVCIG